MNGSTKTTTTPSPTDKLRIGVLGGRGMLGSNLVFYLSPKYEIAAIDKYNYDTSKGSKFEVLVNANGNSRRFWALQNPLGDFEASTASVYRSLFDFKFNKYVYISSSDVYENHADPSRAGESTTINPNNLSYYGFHKYLAEQIVVKNASDYTILRSSMILGKNLRKGPFYDLANNQPLFITLDSRLQFITAEAVAEVINLMIDGEVSGEIFNMGGQGAFNFTDLGKYFDKEIKVSPEAERQEYEMDVAKLGGKYKLKTSEEYLRDFLSYVSK